MSVKRLSVYQSSDGLIFECLQDANEYECRGRDLVNVLEDMCYDSAKIAAFILANFEPKGDYAGMLADRAKRKALQWQRFSERMSHRVKTVVS